MTAARVLAGAVAVLLTASVTAAAVHEQARTSTVALSGETADPGAGEETTTTVEPVTTTTIDAATTATTVLRRIAPKLAVPKVPALPTPPLPVITCPPAPAPYEPPERGVYSVPTKGGDGHQVIPWSEREPQGISFSPDGKRIAYTRWSEDGVTMHIADADGSDETEIDPQADYPVNVDWSPAGRDLAYTAQVEGAQEWAVYLYDIDTAQAAELFRHSAPLGFEWSPDGRSVAAFASHKDPGVWVVDAAGGAATAVRVARDEVWDVSWSPDGARLAYGLDHSAGAFVVGRDGEGRRQVHPRGLRVAWSPVDPARLVVDDAGVLWMVNPDTGAAAFFAGLHLHGWLPDGTKVVATSVNGVHVVATDGCVQTLVPLNGLRIGLRDWAPDSSALLFFRFS